MPNKIIVVTGERDGVGKTTLAVNFAARLSAVRHQPVIIVDADPLCRSECMQAANVSIPMTALQILDQLVSRQLSWPLVRGRLPLNAVGVGVIGLAAQPREGERLKVEQWSFFLQGILQFYDVVIDIDPTSPLRIASLDLADSAIWTLLPNAQSLRSTMQCLETLFSEKFKFDRFLFALNQTGLPQSLSEDAVNQALDRFEENVDANLPFDPEILKLLNQGRSVIVDQKRSPYAQRVAGLVDLASKFTKPRPQSILGLPLPNGANGNKSGAPINVTQSAVVDGILLEKHTRWDKVKQQIHRELVEEMNVRRIDLDTKGDPVRERQLRTNVESTVNALIAKEKELMLTREEREQLVKELVDEALGLGPLEELLRDPTITEIMVNRADQVYTERRGKITLSDKRFIDNNHVIQVIRRIIAPLGRRIDESTPLVDARLKDGSRVNAVIPPLAVNGPSITIRRFPERAFSADDLARIGSLSAGMIEFLRVCVLSKKNIVIAGGTGTGKTTVLNMLSSFIPDDERIVTVEDTAELRLQQEHVVRLEARPPNIEGHGAVTIRDLVKNCLRMRPDRIVVGECRAGEALDMLQAMNTGHDGSLTTIHANSPRDAFTRLETLCLMAGMDLPVWALREQIRSAVHLIVQLSRMQDGSRKITCITEVTGRTDEAIQSQDIFRFVQEGIDDADKVFGHFEATGIMPTFLSDLKAKGMALDLSAFAK